jgi:hypothetical protein
MNLKTALQEEFSKALKKAIICHSERVSKEFSLSLDRVLGLMGIKSFAIKEDNPFLKVDTEDISLERLSKCLRPELVALCKSKKLKCSGTKAELLERLTKQSGNEADEARDKKTEAKSETKVEKDKSKAEAKVVKPKVNSKEIRAMKSATILKKISNEKPIIVIRRNAFNNYEHPITKLVFSPVKTKDGQATVIGKQNDDGTISSLTDEDIEMCKKYNFTYAIPENLDKEIKLQESKNDDEKFIHDIKKEQGLESDEEERSQEKGDKNEDEELITDEEELEESEEPEDDE